MRRCAGSSCLYVCSLPVAADAQDFMGGTCLSGPFSIVMHCDHMRGPGGEAQAYAISRHTTLSVDAEPAGSSLLWRGRHNHGRWPISASKGQE